MESAEFIQVTVFVMTAMMIIGEAYAFMNLPLGASAQLAETDTFTIGSANQTITDLGGPVSNETFTSSIGIFPTFMQALRSQMNISLNEAITISIDAVGTNSSAISGSIEADREFLVYRVFVADIDNNIHMVVVDPSDGKVLFSQQMPSWIGSTMLGISSSE